MHDASSLITTTIAGLSLYTGRITFIWRRDTAVRTYAHSGHRDGGARAQNFSYVPQVAPYRACEKVGEGLKTG